MLPFVCNFTQPAGPVNSDYSGTTLSTLGRNTPASSILLHAAWPDGREHTARRQHFGDRGSFRGDQQSTPCPSVFYRVSPSCAWPSGTAPTKNAWSKLALTTLLCPAGRACWKALFTGTASTMHDIRPFTAIPQAYDAWAISLSAQTPVLNLDIRRTLETALQAISCSRLPLSATRQQNLGSANALKTEVDALRPRLPMPTAAGMRSAGSLPNAWAGQAKTRPAMWEFAAGASRSQASGYAGLGSAGADGREDAVSARGAQGVCTPGNAIGPVKCSISRPGGWSYTTDLAAYWSVTR